MGEAESGTEVEAEAEAETETTDMATMEMIEMEPSDLSQCNKVVELVWVDFREGRISEESVWKAVVLIPKGSEE